MFQSTANSLRFIACLPLAFLLSVSFLMSNANAQTTAFTYQGKLTDSGNPANGSYDLQFKLFDTATVGTGTQQGNTVTVSNVSVTNGIFAVQLDFGACASCFNGAARFLEIAVKPTGGGSFTTLTPRQPFTSTPYAIKTSNLTFNGAFNDGTNIFASNTFAGDGAGVNTTPSGTLSNQIGKLNSFYGAGAGLQNTTGFSNAFFGTKAGLQNTTACCNAFFGFSAGIQNTTGSNNAFFGYQAGQLNTGSNNSFFGDSAGTSNTTGTENSFFGSLAGKNNQSGNANSFFGVSAGFNNTANDNSFFGRSAGFQNTSGMQNSFFGRGAGRDNSTGDNNSFFGYNAGLSNTGNINSFFGAFAGEVTTGSSNNFFGYNAGSVNTTGSFNNFFGDSAGFSNTTGSNNTLIGDHANVSASNLDYATAIGSDAIVTASNRVQIGRVGLDTVVIGAFAAPSNSVPVCANSSNVFTACNSSSLRYKTAVRSFTTGLSIIERLRPITFKWKEDGSADIGLAAEEVAAVDEQFTFRNVKGEIEGVKYTQLTVLFINAFKEQQAQIQQQQQQIKQQQRQIDALTKLVYRKLRRR